MISVIIPLFNKEATILRAVDSILNQTFDDYEIIIVNDGSTDGSVDKLRQIESERIRLIEQKNAGVSAARNKGIEYAKGEFVAFLDADDQWDPDYLQQQMQMVENYPECHMFGTNYRFVDSKGTFSSTLINNIPFEGTTGVLSNYFEVASTSHVPVWTSAVVIRTSTLKEIGCFPAGIKSGEDLLTWARIAVRYPVAYCVVPKASYTLGDGYDFKNEPPRRQDSGDPVGLELKNLYNQFRYSKRSRGMKKYLSHWHKMRASVAIRYGEKIETLKESFRSLRYNPMNFKVIPFIILSFCPSALRKRIISSKSN